MHQDGTLSNRLTARLDAALFLARNYEVEKIIVSGAVGKEGHDEAKKMQEYLVKNAISPEKIWIDSKGYTTQDTSHNAFTFTLSEDML